MHNIETIKTETIKTEKGKMGLCYEITVTPHSEVDFYGISVVSLSENGLCDQTTVNDISSDRDAVEALMELMRVCEVTPLTVMDVVEDFIM